jgi:hypothetical protein
VTETEIYQIYLKSLSPFIEFTRIESGMTKNGIPDIYFLSETTRSHGWIELKIAEKTSKIGVIKVPYRPGQINWLSRHKERGVKAYTLIFYDKFYLTEVFDREFKSIEDLQRKSLWHGSIPLTKEFVKIILK